MARLKKDNHAMTVRLATVVFNKLEEYCEKSGQTKTTAIERAILMYVHDYEEKQEQLKLLSKE